MPRVLAAVFVASAALAAADGFDHRLRRLRAAAGRPRPGAARRLRRAQEEQGGARRDRGRLRRAGDPCGAVLDARAAHGVLDQRLQRLHAPRDRGQLPDRVRVVHAAAPQQHPPDRRRVDGEALARRRTLGEPRRHRARDPASGLRRRADPLRGELRVDRLSAAGRRAVPRAEPRRPARRGGPRVPGEPAGDPRSTAARCACRASSSGMARISSDRYAPLVPGERDATERAILGTVIKYGPPAAASQARSGPRIGFLDYDWSLNDVR